MGPYAGISTVEKGGLPDAAFAMEPSVDGDSLGILCSVSGRALVGSFLATFDVCAPILMQEVCWFEREKTTRCKTWGCFELTTEEAAKRGHGRFPMSDVDGISDGRSNTTT